MTEEREAERKLRLIEVPNPFENEPGRVRLMEPREGLTGEHLHRMRSGALGQPFLIDRDSERHLFFNLNGIQSSMRLDDPDTLVTAYTRKMMAFLLFICEPRHILMIGLGGGSLAKFCYRHLPNTRISVVEINAQVIAFRQHFAIPPDDDRFEIIHEDGATFVARASVTPDVILIDAFDELGVAPSLASPDFYRRASQCLTLDGVLVMNLAGPVTRFPAHIEALRAAFAGAVVLVPVQEDNNILLFAFKQPQLTEFPDNLHSRAATLEQNLGLEFSRFLERLRAGPKLNTTPDPA